MNSSSTICTSMPRRVPDDVAHAFLQRVAAVARHRDLAAEHDTGAFPSGQGLKTLVDLLSSKFEGFVAAGQWVSVLVTNGAFRHGGISSRYRRRLPRTCGG